MKAQLRKVKWNKGTVEGSGQEYDYTRVYVEIPVYEQQQKEFGVDVLELEYGTEADHIKLAHFRGKLPCQVEVEFMPVKKGNGMINLVTKLEVLGQAGQTTSGSQDKAKG